MQQLLYDTKMLISECIRILYNTENIQYRVYVMVANYRITNLIHIIKESKKYKVTLQNCINAFNVLTENANTDANTIMQITTLRDFIKNASVMQNNTNMRYAKEAIFDAFAYLQTTHVNAADDFLQKHAHIIAPLVHNTIYYNFTIQKTMQLRELLCCDTTTELCNRSEFANIKFYFYITPHFRSIVFYHKDKKMYLVGNNNKLYCVVDNKLVHAQKDNKLLHWH